MAFLCWAAPDPPARADSLAGTSPGRAGGGRATAGDVLARGESGLASTCVQKGRMRAAKRRLLCSVSPSICMPQNLCTSKTASSGHSPLGCTKAPHMPAKVGT